MKLYYFNDEQKPIRVFLNGLGLNNLLCTIDSARGQLIEVDVPDSSLLYIKKWSDYIMISSIDRSSFE